MKILVGTVVVEVISLVMLYFATKFSRKEAPKRRLACLLASLVFGVGFVYAAIRYRTVFFPAEIAIYIVSFMLIIGIPWVEQKIKQENIENKKKKRNEGVVAGIVVFFIAICFVILLFCIWRYTENIRFSDEKEATYTRKIEFAVPEECKTFDVEFICIHDSKKEEYRMCYMWENNLYEIETIPQSSVLNIFPIKKGSTPYVEEIEDIYLKKNYNFEKYEEPKVVEDKEEITRKLYLPEGSLKEYQEYVK